MWSASKGWGRYCFHRCLSTPGGGGGGLTPSPSHNTSTGPMSFLGEGYPSDCSQFPSGGGGGGTQSQVGVPQFQVGIPRSQARGTPPPSQDCGTPLSPPPPPETEQQREYLVRGGWYASCVHARGLSCHFILLFSTDTVTKL